MARKTDLKIIADKGFVFSELCGLNKFTIFENVDL